MADDEKLKKKKSKEHDSKKFIDLEPTLESADDEDEILDEEMLDEEPLTLQQRRQRGRTMRRFASKIRAAKERSSRRKASPEKLKQRARKKARGLIRQRLMRSKNYAEMSPAEKVAVDKRLSKISASTINRMAVKQLPKVRQAEIERMAKRGQKKESIDFAFENFLESVEYDNDETKVVNDETPKKKRFHQLFKKEGNINIDRRFKMYRPRDNNFNEDFAAIIESVEENWNLFEGTDSPSSREDGTTSLTNVYKKDTPGQDVNERFSELFGGSDEPLHEFKIYYPKKSDTLGVERDRMPQVASANMPEYFRFLKSNNVSIQKKNVMAKTLKASQGEFDKKKITTQIELLTKSPNGKPILISKDNYVIDGHHRWLAVYNVDGEMSVYQANMNARELIALSNTFPKVFHKTLDESKYDSTTTEELIWECDDLCESDTSCPIISQTAMKQFEGIVDKLFAKYKIDFNFTKHFRERMSDNRNNPCINMKELATMLAKLYTRVKDGKESLSKYKDTEVVLKDLQSDLNMPIALEYDRRADEINVISKTIMRKKNFHSPDKVVRV